MLLMQVVNAATALTSVVLIIEHMHPGIASHGVQVQQHTDCRQTVLLMRPPIAAPSESPQLTLTALDNKRIQHSTEQTASRHFNTLVAADPASFFP